MSKKTLENILLEVKGKRLFVKQGKQEFFTDQMKAFPVEMLSGQIAAYVKIDRNSIVEIKMPDGQIFPDVYKREKSSSSEQNVNPSFIDSSRKAARAPYNFIPLNEKVVHAEECVNFEAYHKERLSGYITLKIETLTPIFVRGNKENLLNPNGELILPGSSIRGLIRSLVEICSYSKFRANHQYEDRKMYFRGMADMANRLRDNYNNEIKAGVEAGYLYYNKQKKSYFIQPAQGFDRVRAIGEFKYISGNDGIEIHSGKMQKKNQNWVVFPPDIDHVPISISPKLIEAYENDENRSEKVFDILRLAQKGAWKSVNFPNGVPVFFKEVDGEVTSFGHTRNYRLPYSKTVSDHIPKFLKEERSLDIPESIFGKSGEAQNDIKAGKVQFEDSVPRKLSEIKTRITALKILASPKATTFQHYLCQPSGFKTSQKHLLHWGDETAHIRGFKQYWHRAKGRDLNKNLWNAESLEFKKEDLQKWIGSDPQIEQTWNESKFSLNVVKDINGNDKIKIEGDINQLPDKLKSILTTYFNIEGGTAKNLNIAKPQNSIVNLILEQETFESRIRFENLTQVELGAILFAIDLPEGCAHKLGMGKPLGLGSVKITPSLNLVDRDSRYEKLFDSSEQFHEGLLSDQSLDKYKDEFAKYIGVSTNQCEIKTAEAFWNQDQRMKELKQMLTFNPAGTEVPSWEAKTRYMQLDEFKSRPILPTPSEVVKPNTYTQD